MLTTLTFQFFFSSFSYSRMNKTPLHISFSMSNITCKYLNFSKLVRSTTSTFTPTTTTITTMAIANISAAVLLLLMYLWEYINMTMYFFFFLSPWQGWGWEGHEKRLFHLWHPCARISETWKGKLITFAHYVKLLSLAEVLLMIFHVQSKSQWFIQQEIPPENWEHECLSRIKHEGLFQLVLSAIVVDVQIWHWSDKMYKEREEFLLIKLKIV